ncbi:PREDICTED: putative F-box protein At5g15670 [Tarenaya hassleriana]|uniref:putative F-box protein At5g15670 n=1 Tax=Tarenaya hassleriana TaxID=28532 RepID=UPI00053C6073|nr:PREDICTED: putative F-box protein At5g15670 [Tarenaya hassleriana]
MIRPKQDCIREKKKMKMKKKVERSTQTPKTSGELKDAGSIPQELKMEILLRLPAKSLVRVVSASKLFVPIIRRRDLINSFLTQSLTRPRFLFTLSNRNRQVITLPKIKSRRKGITCFFGYDPINHQYKVLCMTQLSAYYLHHNKHVAAGEHQVLTLGAREKWRMIECSVPHCPGTDGECVNGVVYYGACTGKDMNELVLVSFDVRSEEFGSIRFLGDVEKSRLFCLTLINYQGKVAIADGGSFVGYDLWILEDAKKHEWSKIHAWHKYFDHKNLFVIGITCSHEIIFAPMYFDRPFYVTYYNVKGNSIRSVEIEGIEDRGYRRNRDIGFPIDLCRIWTFSDHAENIMPL